MVDLPAVTHPEPDEAEVSIFGPGFGECVVVHLGGGDWMVVDSCLDRAHGEPVALKYLRDLKVDVAAGIKLVVATHWHSDHIQGFSRVFEAARAAKFWCSAALRCKEFLTIHAARQDSRMPEDSGVDELSAVLRLLDGRLGDKRYELSVGPEWAISDRCLLEEASKSTVPARKVVALSPSSSSMTLAVREFGDLISVAQNPNRSLPDRSPNEFSVVLWISVGESNILLGGDLVNSGDPKRGWNAIIDSNSWGGKKAGVFKVPHHGSANADNQEVWSKMLTGSPVAGLTPYMLGGNVIPTSTDISRLLERTPHLYSTARPAKWKFPNRPKAVDRTMSEAGRNRRVLRGTMGHIQIRWKVTSKPAIPRVGLAGAAIKFR